MKDNHRIAADLRNIFGAELDAQMTVAAIARQLCERSVYTNRVSAKAAAYDLMWDYEARGLVEDNPGPRGGAGWRLSPDGIALIERLAGS
jgi:hypothetical protein